MRNAQEIIYEVKESHEGTFTEEEAIDMIKKAKQEAIVAASTIAYNTGCKESSRAIMSLLNSIE